LFKTDGDLTGFLLEARRDRSVDLAFVRRFGLTPDAAFKRWAENLPWWGEWVVALSSPNVLWTAVLGLFLLAVLAGWRRRRRKYEALDD
jgi:MYXO-CTERM domain-containing protein